MNLLITNIKELVNVEDTPRLKVSGKEMSALNTIKDAFLRIEGDIIKDFGKMSDLNIENNQSSNLQILESFNRLVFPCFCDSHTHLVYAGSREIEYIDKIKGLSYEEITKRGGGILNSVKKLRETTMLELVEQALIRLEEIISYGTGCVEIKSGYGLTMEDELKMLSVIRKLKELTPLTIKSTFLGAHAVPPEYKGKQKAYVDLIINKMLPQIGEEKLADYIDVFCDKEFFTVDETSRILEAGAKYGLIPKIHANQISNLKSQISNLSAVQVAVKHKALSVDHLECIEDDEINVLKNSETMPTLLPGAAFFLGLKYPPARKLIDSGLPVALASDFNPGSAPSGNMQFILSLGCIKLKMLPEEVINAATLNGAYTMGLSKDYGSIAKGKKANVFITKQIPSYQFMPYAFGSNKVETVILNGQLFIPNLQSLISNL